MLVLAGVIHRLERGSGIGLDGTIASCSTWSNLSYDAPHVPYPIPTSSGSDDTKPYHTVCTDGSTRPYHRHLLYVRCPPLMGSGFIVDDMSTHKLKFYQIPPLKLPHQRIYR